MKTKKTYQVWAYIYNENGSRSWQVVTDKYTTRSAAVRVSNALWLETRIDVEEESVDEDES